MKHVDEAKHAKKQLHKDLKKGHKLPGQERQAIGPGLGTDRGEKGPTLRRNFVSTPE